MTTQTGITILHYDRDALGAKRLGENSRRIEAALGEVLPVKIKPVNRPRPFGSEPNVVMELQERLHEYQVIIVNGSAPEADAMTAEAILEMAIAGKPPSHVVYLSQTSMPEALHEFGATHIPMHSGDGYLSDPDLDSLKQALFKFGETRSA